MIEILTVELVQKAMRLRTIENLSHRELPNIGTHLHDNKANARMYHGFLFSL